MLLEILRALEALAAHITTVWFERYMDPDMTCDVISLDSLGVACPPGTFQTEIISRLPSNMFLAQMILLSASPISAETYIKILRLHKRF